ncbi:MAG: cytochrome c biogenesis protein CcdA [Acidobacteriota bacterium]
MEWLNEIIKEWGFYLAESLKSNLEGGSILAVAIVFAAGILTSFTPCVYPMIPVTVTYIGGASVGSKSKGFVLSLFYVLGLAVIYTSLGAFSALTGKVFGDMTQNPWVYVTVANVIIFFGLSMLGVFTIRLPGFLSGIGKAGKKGGHLGAILMGMAAGFIAAPCTAPVLGVLLVLVGQKQDVLYGAFLLLMFALGMGVLFIFLGTFTGLLATMPKAGAWMDRIKIVFGIAMIVIGEYFLLKAGRMLSG